MCQALRLVQSMDEQNARASQETFPSTELNEESSNFSAADSVRENLPSAEQNKPTHDLETTGKGPLFLNSFLAAVLPVSMLSPPLPALNLAAGNRSCLVDLAPPARERVGVFSDDNAPLKDATFSHRVVTQLCLRDNEDAKDRGEFPACIQSMEIEHLNPDQQLHASAPADMDMIDGDQEDRVDAASEDISMPDGGAALTRVDGPQETGGSHYVQVPALFLMDGSCDEEASLEMLSGAVESFKNMQRRSEEGLLNVSNVLENPELRKEHRTNNFEGASVEREKDCINKLSMTKSTSESEDNESFVVDDFSAPSAEFQDKEHFLNMLCESAAVHQEERERSSMSKQVASYMASLADNDALCDEPKRLSFVDFLKKQMVHAHALTDLSAGAIYKAFLKQNQQFLGREVGKELNQPMPSGSIVSKEGAVAILESEQKSNRISYREGNAPSTDETSHDSKSGDLKSVEKVEGNSKEETGDDERSFVVGDLVWAKVKSHPWWPGQIFDAADASVAANRIEKPGRTLVAFFGDGTFGWLWQSQLIPFEPNFGEKVKQTTMKSFCRAVVEALEEVSRRMELGLRCSHSGDAMYSRNLFPDLNAGVRKGVRLKCHKDIEVSKGQLHPERVLKFVRTAACSPLYPLSSGLEYSKLGGHVYGFRSFMLSSKRPDIKPNMIKAQKKENFMQRSELKRRYEQSELGGGPNLAAGKESKRINVSKDAGVRESSAGGRVLSPRYRSIDLLSSEAEESKAGEFDLKSHEQVQESTWLAKGKRLHVPLDCNEKKRAGGWLSLGPSRDAKKSGLEMTVDTSLSSDDDNRTLFDITGYHSLKRKKKGVPKSTIDVPSKDAGQQQLKIEQEPSKKPWLANLDESLPDSGNSSLSVMVSQPDPCLSPVTEDFRNAEESTKAISLQNAGTQDLKNAEKGVQDLQHFRNAEKGNEDTRDQLELKDADLELREQIKGETSDLKDDCAENSKEQEAKLLYLKADDPEENEKIETLRKVEVKVESEKIKETRDVKVAEKGKREVFNSGPLEQCEKNEGEMGVENFVKKQTKRVHFETGDNLGRSIKLKKRKRMHFETDDNLGRSKKLKKRRQATQDKVKLILSSVKKNKEIITRDSVKTSKLGLSIRKVAGALKAIPRSFKSAKHITSKESLSTATVECAISKETKGLNSDHPSPKRPVSASRSGLIKDSLSKLLNTLQVVATDPLSSANMRNSLEGVTPFLLKFRNMVFLKSSGYSAAAAAGKLMPIANGHHSGDTKVEEKGLSGRKIFTLGTQQTGSKDSSAEQEAPLKIESCIESIGGSGSQRLVELDTFCEAKAVDIKEQCPLNASPKIHGSDGQNSSDNETDHGKVMTAGNKRPLMQDLAVAARKRKSEALQESATKTLGQLKGLPQKLLPEKKFNKETVADTRNYAKSEKHHISRGDGLLVSEKKSPMQSSGSAKVALGLFMQFPEHYTLPSETELRELFNRFGTLETFGIRVYKNASTAQVVFKHSGDAEAAWQHARKNRMFGQANVSYRLCHFSLSSKSESRFFSLASAKKGSLDVRKLKSTTLENLGKPFLAKQSTGGPEKGSLMKPHSLTRDSLLNRAHIDKEVSRVPEQSATDITMSCNCEPVPARSPAGDSSASECSPEGLRVVEQAPVQIALRRRFEGMPSLSPSCMLQPTVAVPPCVNSSPSGPELGVVMGPPIIHQLEAIQSPSSVQCAVASNLLNSPSMSSVNVASGDIQDQMMKLLQQVSVIVSSTALTHKST